MKMIARRCTYVAALAFLLGLGLTQARSNIFTFTIPSGVKVGGQSVSANAVITTGAGTISVTLNNTQANPTSVIQTLSDLFVSFNNSQVSGTLMSSSGMERTIASGGTYTNGPVVSTGWQVDSVSSSGLRLHVLDTPVGPSHLIIGAPNGSNKYSNANGSIASNGPHNPFLAESATFNLNVAGVTSSTTITGATFSFGTTEGNNVTVGGPPPPPPVPEPASIVLAGLGLVGFAAYRQLRRRSA